VMQDLFTAFNIQYDRLNGELLDIAKGTFEGDPERVIIDYVNLCAEEYFWYTRGRIDTAIWRAWRNGMENWLQVPAIRAVVERERLQRDSFTDCSGRWWSESLDRQRSAEHPVDVVNEDVV
jgi:hypothetical protein